MQSHTKNDTVLERIGEKRNIMQLIMSRKLTFFGHIIRRDNLHRVILEGHIPSRQPKEDKDNVDRQHRRLDSKKALWMACKKRLE